MKLKFLVVLLLLLFVSPAAAEISPVIPDWPWARTNLYLMCHALQGKKILSQDGIFDCDDWALWYLTYINSYREGHDPTIVIIVETDETIPQEERSAHAMAKYTLEDRYILADPQTARMIVCFSDVELPKAVEILYLTSYPEVRSRIFEVYFEKYGEYFLFHYGRTRRW